MDLYIFSKVDQGRIQTFSRKGKIEGQFLKVFRQNEDLSPPVDCAPSPVLYNPVLDVSMS